jgi:non-ribosomal peptide synthetase-like protein
MINGYGPTECAVTCVRGPVRAGEPITIGWPVRGFEAWVLDESLEEVADGTMGELCLGGVGLARGYRNRPQLTAEKFPTHPKFGRIYRTGDLVERAADGSYIYHGRIDSQVKLRGHRVELEAIEARLAECAGVREAACRVQSSGARQLLVAFVVPESDSAQVSFADLKSALRESLPDYMVPSHFGLLPELPTTIGGKLDRKSLPEIEVRRRDEDDDSHVAPRDDAEARLSESFRVVTHATHAPSVHEDFFNDLGGDSLSAAELISRLRDDPATASLTVRDLYEARTVAELAKRLDDDNNDDKVTTARDGETAAFAGETGAGVEGSNALVGERASGATKAYAIKSRAEESRASASRRLLAGCVQMIWLLAGLVVGSAFAYLASFDLVPWLTRDVGLIPLLLLSPLFLFAALVIYTPLAVLFAALVKRVLVGRYRPQRAPVWGSFYVRNWMVQQTVRVVPWALIAGTEFQCAALRALGARIGRRVHIHRGVNLLQGGWDLLEIGDDVTLSQDAAVRLVELEDGEIVVSPVSIGDGSTLAVRAGIGGDTVLEAGAYLDALSSLSRGGRVPRGERWSGVPAQRVGASPQRATVTNEARELSPVAHGVALVSARFALGALIALPFELALVAATIVYRIDSQAALAWLSDPSLDASLLWKSVLLISLPVPFTLALEALAARAMGRVRPGVVSRRSWAYVRVWLKTELLTSASAWLSGTLLWPHWLRLAGMRIGRGCEISTIIDTVPELVEIGAESFFADGIYLCGPLMHRGAATLAETRFGANTFLGNHAVIPIGQTLPADILIGVSTASDDTLVRPGTSWFGHPPFELPRREIVACDRSLTHEPSTARYLNRVFFELLRFGLPVLPVLVFGVWYKLAVVASVHESASIFFLVDLPSLGLAMGAFFCLFVLALKWLLLGRVRPGQHPLWSCWVNRWDLLYMAWGFYASAPLSALEGTPLLACYLRAMGARIGRGVVLGGGFAQVVDPDMLNFEDGATVCCQFQAHTFEDRVLKIDHVWIRRRATVGEATVMLYGADVGEGARVAPHSVVMKRERLLPGHSYAGCPTRPQ